MNNHDRRFPRAVTIGLLLSAMLLGFVTANLTAQEAPQEPPKTPSATKDEALLKCQEALERIETKTSENPAADLNIIRQNAGYVLRLDPKDVRANYYEARARILMGFERETIRVILDYVNHPSGRTDWRAYLVLAKIYLRGGFYEQALSKVQHAIDINPLEPELFAVKSMCLRNLGKHDLAIEAARFAIQRDPENPDNYVILAEAYKEKRMIVEAAREVTAAIELNKEEQRKHPEDVQQIINLQSKFDLAKEILNVVIELQLNQDAPQPQPFLQYINLLEDEANLKKLMVYYSAINLLETAVEASTPRPHPELVMELVRVKVKVGQIEGAKTILERVIEADPRNMRANRWLENLKAGQPLEEEPGSAPSAMR